MNVISFRTKSGSYLLAARQKDRLKKFQTCLREAVSEKAGRNL